MGMSAWWTPVLGIGLAATVARTLGLQPATDAPSVASGAALQLVWRDQSVPQRGTSIEYRNRKYRFCVALPISWRGFSIVEGQWEGHATRSDSVDHIIQRGPIIS